jgi:hypothetical protein
MNLKRQLKDFLESAVYHSNLASNISLMLNFERWSGCLNFEQLIRKELNAITEVPQPPTQTLIGSEHGSVFQSYLADPFKLNLKEQERDIRLYKYLGIKNVPSARSIRLIKQAHKKMQQNNPEEIEFWLYFTFP